MFSAEEFLVFHVKKYDCQFHSLFVITTKLHITNEIVHAYIWKKFPKLTICEKKGVFLINLEYGSNQLNSLTSKKQMQISF